MASRALAFVTLGLAPQTPRQGGLRPPAPPGGLGSLALAIAAPE